MERLGAEFLGTDPVFWLNKALAPADQELGRLPMNVADLNHAYEFMQAVAGLLVALFPADIDADGVIDSELVSASRLASVLGINGEHLWIKCDHALPIAGSIKARGGFYEVLLHARDIVQREVSTDIAADPSRWLDTGVCELLSHHKVVVGSTGNLALSVATMARALGFECSAHMSREAREWKKQRLRGLGVDIIEYDDDVTTAVTEGRKAALADEKSYFVDDEKSTRLFLGYAVAAIHLAKQFDELGVRISEREPLFVYLPCGVGGSPAGITWGLKHVFGDAVHCFTVEPCQSPSMLLALSSKGLRIPDVYQYGFNNRTIADGLAVARVSESALTMTRHLLSGCLTLSDEQLIRHMRDLNEYAGLQVEPSAAAGLTGPCALLETEVGSHYIKARGLGDAMHRAHHIVWTTGGAHLPAEEFSRLLNQTISDSTGAGHVR